MRDHRRRLSRLRKDGRTMIGDRDYREDTPSDGGAVPITDGVDSAMCVGWLFSVHENEASPVVQRGTASTEKQVHGLFDVIPSSRDSGNPNY